MSIHDGSRPSKEHGFFERISYYFRAIEKIKRINEFAEKLKQSLAQMALFWLSKDKRITSVLIGARSVEQLGNNIHALSSKEYSEDELLRIDNILR